MAPERAVPDDGGAVKRGPGRPPLPEHLRKTPAEYVPKGRGRGRPKKVKGGASKRGPGRPPLPEHLRKTPAEYVPKGRGRGRPKKVKELHSLRLEGSKMAEVKPLVLEVGDETFVITQNNDEDDLDTNEVEASPEAPDVASVEDDLEELSVHFDINFECHLCDKKFSNKIDLRSHLDKEHVSSPEKQTSVMKRTPEYVQTDCLFCGLSVLPEDLEAHKRTHIKTVKSFHCLSCKADFDIAFMKNHTGIHAAEKPISIDVLTDQEQTATICTICGVQVDPKDLDAHNRSHQKPAKSFHCLICQTNFPDIGSLTSHRKVHAAEKQSGALKGTSKRAPILCTTCGVLVPNEDLESHTLLHKNSFDFFNGFCKLCNLYFSNVEIFMGHMDTHGKPAEQSDSSYSLMRSSSNGAGSGSTFECGYCQQKFDRINETRIHLDIACLFCPFNIIKRPSLEMYASLNSDLAQQCFSFVLRDKPVVIKQIEKYRENPLETSSGQVSDKSMAKKSSAVAMSASETQVGTQPPMYASVGLGNQVKNTTVTNPANAGRIYRNIIPTGMQQTVRNAGSGNQANRNIGMTTTILLTDNQPNNNTGKQQQNDFFLPSSVIQKQRSIFKNVSLVNKAGIRPQPVTFTQSGNQPFIRPGVQPTIFPNTIVQNQANISAGTNPPSSVLATQLPNTSMMASTSAAEVPEEASCSLPTSRGQGTSTSGTQGPWSNVSRGNNGSRPAQHPSANSGGKKAKLKCGYCYRLFHSAVSIRQHQRDEHVLVQLIMAGQTDAQIERRGSTERTTLTVGGALSFNSRVRKGNKKKNKKTECRSVRKSSTDTASDFSDEPEIEIKTEPNTDCPDPPEEKSLQDENTCDICFHTFCSVYNVQRHKKLVHRKKSGAPEPVSQSHAFPSIRSVFDRAHLYQRPDPIWSQRINCASCGKTFAQKKVYMQHQRYHCKGKRLTAGTELKCQHCGITFKQRKYLRKHHCFRRCKARVERTENEEQIIKCDVCGRIFADKSGLTKHKRYHCLGEEAAAKLSHTQSNSPQFICDCGQKFTERSSLQRHKLVYRCKKKMSAAENSESDDEQDEDTSQDIKCDCGQTFTLKSSLQRHKLLNQCKNKKSAAENSESDEQDEDTSQDIKCDCGQTFTLKSSLQRHKLLNQCKNKKSAAENSESDEQDEDTSQDTKCACGQTFTLKSSLQRHKLLNRCKSKTSANEISVKSDKKYLQRSQDIICDDCGKIFIHKSSLGKHQRYHCSGEKTTGVQDANSSQTIRCDDCGQTFTLKKSLRKHQRYHCSGEKTTGVRDANSSQTIRCDDCGRTFTLQKSLRKHQRYHCSGEKTTGVRDANSSQTIRCDDCGRTFTLQKSLRKHQRYHCSGEKTTGVRDANSSQTIRCDDCGRTFTLQRSLRKHQRYHCSGEKTTGVRDATSSQTIRCDDCGRTFTLQRSLRKHQMLHCAGGKAADENDDECTCSKCGKVFLHADSLRKHFHYRCKGHLTSKSVRIEKTNFCGICGKNFLHKDSLRKHKLYHCKGKVAQSKTSDKKIECGECRRTFSYKESLVRHQKFSCKTKENDSRKYVCSCGSSYYSKDVYRRHKKYICKIKSPAKGQNSPAKEKKSPARGTEPACDVCGKVYMYWDSVVRHKKTNCKGSTMCDACGKSFEDLDSLRKHKRFYCTNQPAGIYPCGYCERYFNDLSNRRRHEKNLHKIKSPHSQSHGLKIRSENPKVDSDNSVSVNTKLRKITSSTSPVVTLDRFLCHLCKKSFVTMEMLQKHKDQDHEDREMEKINTPIRQMHSSANSSPEKSDFSHIIASPQKLVVQLTKIDDDPNQVSTGNDKSTEGLCLFCGHDFHRQCKLKIHLQTCLKDDGKSVKKSVGDLLVNPPSLREAEVKRQSSREAEVKLPSSREAMETERAICDLCGNSYYDNSTMLRHRKKCERFQSMSSKAKGEVTEKSVCDICGNSYYSKGALTRHKMLCVFPKPSSIKKVVPNLSRFKSGIKQVTIQNKCDLCGNKYSLKGSLVRHRKKCAVKHAKEKRLQIKQKSKPKSMPSIGPNGLAKCKYCRRLFHPKSLCRHIQNIHGTKMNKSVPGKSGGKSPASTKKNLLAVTSGNLYPCDLCDKAFVNRFNMHRHKRICHPTEHTRHIKQAHGKELSQEKKKENLKTTNKKEPAPEVSETKSSPQINRRRKIDIIMYESYTTLLDKKAKSDNEPKCDVCGTVFMHKKSIKKHMRFFHPEEFNKIFQTTDSKTSDNLEETTTMDDGQEESRTTISADHISKGSPLEATAGVDVELEGISTDGVEDQDKHSVDKDSLTEQQDDSMVVDGTWHNDCIDNKESTIGLPDGDIKDNTDERSQQEESACPMEVEEVPESSPRDTIKSLEDKDEVTSERKDLGESNSNPSRDEAVDITRHSDGEKTQEAETMHPEGHGHLDDDKGHLINEHDKVTSHHSDREKDDLVEQNPESSSSHLAPCKDKEKCTETIEEEMMESEGIEVQADEEIPPCNDNDLSDENEETASDSGRVPSSPNPKQEDEDNLSLNEEIKNSNEGILHEEEIPKNDEVPQHEQNTQNVIEDNPQNNEETCYQEEADNPPHEEEEETPEIDEEENQEIDDKVNQQIDEDQNPHQNQHDADFVEEDNPEHVEDNPGHNEEDNPEHVVDNPGHNEEDNPEHVEDNPGHNEEEIPEHVVDNPRHNNEDNPEHNEEEIPEHVEDNPGHNEEDNPEHVVDNPGPNEEEIPQGLEANSSQNNAENSPQNNEENISPCGEDDKPQSNEEESSQPDEESNPQSNGQDSLQNDKDTPQPDDLSV